MDRMRVVLTWMTTKGIGIRQVHEPATDLMGHFLEHLEPLRPKGLTRRGLIYHSVLLVMMLLSGRTTPVESMSVWLK
jgi:hypothetical protein